jgi:Protein of unknown function (DUF1559)
MRHIEGSSARHGLTAVELMVVLFLTVMGACVLLMAIPHAREQARLTGCRRNLGQIGLALALYEQSHQQLPSVAALGGLEGSQVPTGPSPLRILLETLELPDLMGITDPRNAPAPSPGEVPGEMPVPGFVCASDPYATAGLFGAPISYRAVTGDSPAGENGIFAPGRIVRLQQVEAVDGLSYTAAFSERLVGNNRRGEPALANYAAVSGAVPERGCPAGIERSAWRGDAGASWRWADYRSTLYNHALKPNGQPSCVAIDGQTACTGASSGHLRGVHLLLLDGSVTLMRPAIDLKVWREFARVNNPDVLESPSP